MSNHKDALNFIKKLLEKYSAGGYVFRGANEEYSKKKSDGINSTLYRKVMEENEGKELKETLKKDNREFFPAYMEEKIVNEARRYFLSSASNLEILTDLQHFGGATNMIDFSRSIYVALFFACLGSTDSDGEFIALDLNEADKIDVIDYKESPKKGKLEIIAPAHSQNSNYRVNFQGSIFVRPAEGYIPRGKCKVETVSKELKKHLLQCIKNAGGITSGNIYNDFHGVITTQKDFLKRNTFSYLAKAHYFSGNLDKSIFNSNKSIALNPDESYTDYNDRGIIHTLSQKYQCAIQDFDRAISLKFDFAEAYSNRGHVYDSLGQHQRAIEDLNKAISLNPKSAPAYNNRGNAYDNLNQHQRAIVDFDKAISLNPNFAEAYSNRGVVYGKMGQYQRAIEDFGKAILLNPKSASAYSNRGNAYYHLKQYKRALEDVKTADSINPRLAEIHFSLGNIYFMLEKYSIAIKNYSKAISLDRDYAYAYHNRGLAKKNMGNIKDVKADYAKAKKLGLTLPEDQLAE